MDKTTYKLLTLFYRKKNCSYSQIQTITRHEEYKSASKHTAFLFTEKFINYWESDELIEIGGIQENKRLGYSISLKGEAYVEQRRRDGRNFWIPYIITTCIAVASLLVALAGLFRESDGLPENSPGNARLYRSQECICVRENPGMPNGRN